MNKLNTGYSKIKNEELDNKADTIVKAMTGNASFPDTTTYVTATGSALGLFRQALALPDGSIRNAQVAETRGKLVTALENLARSIELTPDLTEAMLATTGYDLRQPASRTSDLVGAPANIRLKTTGVTGEVQVLFDAVPRAKAYEVQFTIDPNAGPWTPGGTFVTTRSVILKGLTRAKDYWVRVRAVGSGGPGGWGDPATILVS